jgi:hypothetical protein
MLSIFAVACCAGLSACSEGGAAETTVRADVIIIDGMKAFGDKERPPVEFAHDKHTEALAAKNKDCSTCHLQQENGYLSPLYQRLANTTRQEVMDIYHGGCIDCHTERKAENAEAKAGPVTCGDCHRNEPLFRLSRRPAGMDKSLHYRHVAAGQDKCEACHHIYDEASKKLIYVKGKENSCRDCHRSQEKDDVDSYRTAAHSSCIQCHLQTTTTRPGEPHGPVACSGCHDAERQAAYAVIEDPPRLMRGQPDFVLLSAPEAERESSKLNTVPFSHVGHEGFNQSCRVCHHESMQACSDCHTLQGEEKGGSVTLQQAMHDINSTHSCIGCHERHKTEIGCAGCHDQMEQARLSEHSCMICHAGPAPDEVETVRSQYTTLDDFRPKPGDVELSFTVDDIPEQVTIDVISKRYDRIIAGEYDPVAMPHRRIVNTLRKHIEDNKIAVYFHGHEDVVCQGCHHHGSIGRRPALCENCHGEPFKENDLFKPGLYGAYHRQCVGCHVSMKLQNESDCTYCHKDQAAVLDEATSRQARRGSRP